MSSVFGGGRAQGSRGGGAFAGWLDVAHVLVDLMSRIPGGEDRSPIRYKLTARDCATVVRRFWRRLLVIPVADCDTGA